MNTIAGLFLKMRHWQVFMLAFALPFLLEFLFMWAMLTDMGSGIVAPALFLLMLVLGGGTMIGWLFSVGWRFSSLVPEGARMNVGFFKFSVVFPVIYAFAFFALIAREFTPLPFQGAPAASTFELIMPVHLLAMFCMFYVLYFASKTFKMAEIRRRVGFGDYAGEFFLMWFFPLGIWFLQPRITKLFKDNFANNGD